MYLKLNVQNIPVTLDLQLIVTRVNKKFALFVFSILKYLAFVSLFIV